MQNQLNSKQGLWQPTLEGEMVVASPLQESHLASLFAAASDPKIWELHPVPDRYTLPKFQIYFRTGIESNGALIVFDKINGEVIGSSRFTAHDLNSSKVEIGYTFFKCSRWGTGANQELKTLMLNHAFQFVECVEFFVGAENWRSQAAMKKSGGKLIHSVTEKEPEGDLRKSLVYKIAKDDFKASKPEH
jgi:N-acetyltransferase